MPWNHELPKTAEKKPAVFDRAFAINLYSFKFHPCVWHHKTEFFYIPPHYMSDVRIEHVSSTHSAF